MAITQLVKIHTTEEQLGTWANVPDILLLSEEKKSGYKTVGIV